MEDAPKQTAPRARPAAPTTVAEHERSLRVIRIAIVISIVAIVLMTWIFVAYLDAPTVPLVPLAAFVAIVDIFMLVVFTRQRRRAIEALRRRESGLPG